MQIDSFLSLCKMTRGTIVTLQHINVEHYTGLTLETMLDAMLKDDSNLSNNGQ